LGEAEGNGKSLPLTTSDSGLKVLNTALAKVLKEILLSAVLCFFIAEAGYLFLIYAPIPKYPIGLVALLALIIAGTSIADTLFSDKVAALTLIGSPILVAIMINLGVGDSPNTTLFPFNTSFISDAFYW
jgi:hypothetical protein